jgi:AcrR family transcriptional regulator
MNEQTQRQIEIIKASVKLIGKKGISSLTTRNLSQALGVTEPIIYRHFKNKTAIIAAILSFLEENNRKISGSIVKKDAPALSRIEELYLRHFNGFMKMPALTTAIFSEELYQKEKILTDSVLKIIAVTNDSIETMLSDGIRKREVRADISVQQMTFIIMGSMRFAVTKWRLTGYKTDLVSIGKELCSSFNTLFSINAGNDHDQIN